MIATLEMTADTKIAFRRFIEHMPKGASPWRGSIVRFIRGWVDGVSVSIRGRLVPHGSRVTVFPFWGPNSSNAFKSAVPEL